MIESLHHGMPISVSHIRPQPARKRLSGIMLVGLLAAITPFGQGAEPGLPATEYALYSALLNHGLDPASSLAVIADSTTGDPARIVTGGPTEARAQELNTTLELLSEWWRLNHRSFALSREFKLRVPFVMFRETDRDLVFRGDEPTAGWKQFFARYAGSAGVVRLSRAALDRQDEHALVYLEFQCGPECGSGRLVHLARDVARDWQVEGGELIWMAGPE